MTNDLPAISTLNVQCLTLNVQLASSELKHWALDVICQSGSDRWALLPS
jgi:hypothetical protein